MKRLVILLLLLTPWAMRSMEPEEKAVELKRETLAQDRPSVVRLVEEILPGDIPHSSSTKISQVIAQEILQKKPEIRQFIFDTISLPFKDFGYVDEVTAVKFNSTGDKIVTASGDGFAQIWDLNSGEFIHVLIGDSVKSNPAGDKIIIFSDSDNVARLWDPKTDTFITLEGHTSHVLSAAFNPAGDNVATGSRDGTAKIWDVETGKLIHTLKHDIVAPVVFNRAGDNVATGSRDGTAMIWHVETGTPLHTLKGQSGIPLYVVGFNSTGDKVVTTATTAGTGDTKIWDVNKETVLRTLVTGGSLLAMVSPAGNKVATGPLDGPISIWDVETGDELHSLKGYDNVWLVAFNPAGDKVLTIPHSGDAPVRIWDVKSGELLHRLSHDGKNVRSAVFNPAGDKVAVAFENEVRIWDLEPLLKSQEFLAEDITHRQVAILNDIFAVIDALHYLKELAFARIAPLLRLENILFDFNKYPQTIWYEYNAMPEVIRRIFDPYVTKLSSNTEEQAPIGS